MKTKPQRQTPTAAVDAATWMVRLPPTYRDQLAKAVVTSRRTVTTELKVALEAHLAALGLWPPKE